MLFWALMAAGQIVMSKVDGWETLSQPLDSETLTSPTDAAKPHLPGDRNRNFHHLRDANLSALLPTLRSAIP